jgi:hypothetical protein
MFGNMLSVRTGALAGIFCAFVAASARADDWGAYQHDLSHTGYTASNPSPAALKFAWQAPTGFASPLVVGNSVLATHNGAGTGTPTIINSFNLNTGAVNWTFSKTLTFPSQAAYGGGLVAFGSGSDATTGFKLSVLDAATGTAKYDVTLGISPSVMPLMVPESNGTVTAYVMNSGTLKAVSLGASSGSVLWTATGQYSSFMMPTLAGSSVVVANAGNYYAYDRSTGTVNHFQTPGASGIGTTPAYDATRALLYILAGYSGTTTAITAYHYASNGSITQAWQYTGVGVKDGNSVAIGPNGDIYSVDNTTLVELSSVDGHVVRSLPGQSFANGLTPIISGNTLWTFNPNGANSKTIGYDLTSLNVVASLPFSRGDELTAYSSAGAADDLHFLTASTTTFGQNGFQVYAVPEPGSLGLAALGAAAMLLRRRRVAGR